MMLTAGCELTFESSYPTPLILMLRPASGAAQWVMREEYALSPHVPVVEYTDAYGNLCQRMTAPIGTLRVRVTATVDTSDTIDIAPGAPFTDVSELPHYVIQYLLPSRYCESDMLNDRALEIVGDAALGYDQASAICTWIHRNIEYCYGTSDGSTSAIDTLEAGEGVCRDFAHLGMALCRAINLPARMVVGWLHNLEPMDLHAWYEVFVNGRWYTFDPTQPQPRGGRIAIAYGHDASDVALATQFGPGELTELRVWVEEAAAG